MYEQVKMFLNQGPESNKNSLSVRLMSKMIKPNVLCKMISKYQIVFITIKRKVGEVHKSMYIYCKGAVDEIVEIAKGNLCIFIYIAGNTSTCLFF